MAAIDVSFNQAIMKITIVTVCYNAVDLIGETIRSVLEQTYADIEYIVIDGGSVDGTNDVIGKYKESISYVVSEADNGIYDAMNKGIKAATGDFVNFLNAGDVFCNSRAVEDVVRGIEKTGKSCDVVYGDVMYKYAFGKKYVPSKPLTRIRYDMVFSHQSVFVQSGILKNRPFSLKYKLAADYDFLLWAYLNGYSFVQLSIPVSIVDVTDGATNSNFVKSRKESFEIQLSYGGNRLLCYSWFLWTVIYFKIVTVIKRYFPKSILKRLISNHNG